MRNVLRMKTELVAISATIPPDLLAEIDRRARSMDMTRSQYIRSLARKDLADKRGELPAEPDHEAKEAA